MLAPEAFSAAKLKSVATGIVSWKHPSLLFSTALRADSPFSCKEVNANITKLCSVCRRTFYTFVASFMYSIPDTASLGTEILNNDNCAVHQTFFQMPEMFDRPFSFSLIKGLGRGGTEGRARGCHQGTVSLGLWQRDRPSCTPPEQSAAVGINLLGCCSTWPLPKAWDKALGGCPSRKP